jgi:hypothetical protein
LLLNVPSLDEESGDADEAAGVDVAAEVLGVELVVCAATIATPTTAATITPAAAAIQAFFNRFMECLLLKLWSSLGMRLTHT